MKIIFRGIVNGKEFHDRKAFDNYVKDLQEPITEYVTETETYYSDDTEQIEAERNEGCNCDGCCKKERLMRQLVAPKPYTSVVDYIIPCVDEVEHTANLIAEEPERLNRVENNLNERLDYFVNEIEFAEEDVDVEGLMDNIVEAAKVTAKHCTEELAKAKKEVFNIEEEIARLERRHERAINVRDFYDNLAGYATAMADK